MLLRDGKFAPVGTEVAPGTPILADAGRIALPGLVEAHTHLDKSLLGIPWYRNEVGSRLIDNERATHLALPIPPARQVALSVGHSNSISAAMPTWTPNAACWSVPARWN